MTTSYPQAGPRTNRLAARSRGPPAAGGKLPPMRRLLAVLALVAVAATAAVWIFRPDRAIAVGTASTSLTLCGDIFVTGLPAGRAFAEDASGNLGQRVVIVPSQHLVVVRLGATVDPPDFDISGLIRLVADVMAAGR